MSNLLHSDDRDIPPGSSLGGKVDVACPGMANEAPEREGRSFPGRVVGLSLRTLGGQPVRETIGFAAVRVGRCFGLLVSVSDWPLWFPPALEFLETPLSGDGQVSVQRFRGKDEGYIYLVSMLQRDGSVLPLLFCKLRRYWVLMGSMFYEPTSCVLYTVCACMRASTGRANARIQGALRWHSQGSTATATE
jgi:hypothetical protein